MSVELITAGATMNFVMLASSLSKSLGEAFLILVFTTDTAVSGLILALLVIACKRYGTADIDEIMRMEREKKRLKQIVV